MKNRLLFILPIFFLFAVMGCNTLKGLGEDFSAVGGWITRGADKVKEKTQNIDPE